MNIDCQSPKMWQVNLIKINSSSFKIKFSFNKEEFTKIIQSNDGIEFKDCLILFQSNLTNWVFQKFDFTSFENDVDFKQMLEIQVSFLQVK